MFDLQTTSGVVVAAVNPASEAYTRGIMAGDVIEKVQDIPVASATEMMDLIESAEHTRRFVSLLVTGKAGTRWISLYAGAEEGAGSASPQSVSPPATRD